MEIIAEAVQRRVPPSRLCCHTITTSDKGVSVDGVPDWNGKRTITARRAFLALALLFLHSSCTNVGVPPSPQWSQVGISDFTSIAGQWQGTMRRDPPSQRIVGDDWVQVMIRQDGEYAFQNYRPIGVLKGQGKLTIADGKATVWTDEGE